MAGPGGIKTADLSATQFNAAARLAGQPYEWRDDGDGNPEPGELFFNNKPMAWSGSSLELVALQRRAKNLLVFEPSRVTPERRIYEKGKGVSLNPRLLGHLDKKALTATLREALGVAAPSCREREFAGYVIRKFKEIGVEVEMDDLLTRFAALPEAERASLSCDDGKTNPQSGNVIARLPATNPNLPSVHLSFHLDRVPDPNLTVVEKKGHLYSDGKTILGADDAAGFALIYHVVKLLKEQNVPHGEILIVGFPAEEDSQVGSRLIADRYKVGDLGIVPDATRTDGVHDAGPDLYFGSYTVEQTEREEAPKTPFSERLTLLLHGATQHPMFSAKAINAIAVAIQILKKAGLKANGTVQGHSDVTAFFKIEGGQLKEGTRQEVAPNGNQVPSFARVDLLVQGQSPEAIATFRRHLTSYAREVTDEATAQNRGGERARYDLMTEPFGEAPTPSNASALLAEALMQVDVRFNNHPGGNQSLVFQANQILFDGSNKVSGGWQLRSGDPTLTEPFRGQWEGTVFTVAGAHGGQGSTDLMTGKKLMDGYKLPPGDPTAAAFQEGYRIAGLPPPRMTPTFGGSNVNDLIKDRGSMLLVGIGADFIHTEREYWDAEDGLLAAKVILASVLYANQFGRVHP